MNKTMKKIRGGEGFTLVEMLIVVAIIAILIAISIPLVNSALERAKHATDAANERSAKALFVVAQLSGYLEGTSTAFDSTKVYYYDAKKGAIVTDLSDDNVKALVGYGKHGNHSKEVIAMSVQATDNDTFCMKWVTASSTSYLGGSDSDLCSMTDATTRP